MSSVEKQNLDKNLIELGYIHKAANRSTRTSKTRLHVTLRRIVII